MHRRIGVACAGVAIVAGAIAMAPTTACQTHQCDGATVDGKDDAGNPTIGGLASGDPNTWESGPIEGPWLNFGPEETYIFHLPVFDGREVTLTVPYLSVDPMPTSDMSEWVVGAGNSVEFWYQYYDGMPLQSVLFVHNGTCAQYWLRVVVTATPAQDASPVVPADASTYDSPDDASNDAPTEDVASDN